MATNTLCQGLPPVNCPFMANTPPRVTTRLLFMATAKGFTTHCLELYVLHTGLIGQNPMAPTVCYEQLNQSCWVRLHVTYKTRPASTGGDQVLSTCLIRENAVLC